MYIVREGVSVVGVQFVGTRATYLARGWIKSLEILRDGPKCYSLYFNNTRVAYTTNGVITVDNFTAEALNDLKQKTLAHDKAQFLVTEQHFNMTGVGNVTIIADEPPTRQNYYFEQTWSQVFKKRDNSNTGTDMDLQEVPCIVAFNLREGDARIARTYPHPENNITVSS